MSGGLTIDVRQFNRALKNYRETTRKSLPEILNQRAFNIAARAVDSMLPNPGGEQSERAGVRQYMETPKSEPRLRVAAGGKRRGQFVRVGSKKNRLLLKNLLIQARRKKKGMKGLYGEAMREQADAFSRRAQVGVGFLKLAFLPVIKGLNALVKFRKVATRWGRISVWAGSAGYGKVTPARTGSNSFVEMLMRWKVPGTAGKVSRMVVPHLQAAFDAEAREINRHVAEKLQKEADKINARK